MLCKLHVLIIGNDDKATMMILNQLGDVFGNRVHLECASNLPIAFESLVNMDFDAVLIDTSVADVENSGTLSSIRSLARHAALFLLVDRPYPIDEIDPGEMEIRIDRCLLKGDLEQGTWVEPLYMAMRKRLGPKQLQGLRLQHYHPSATKS